MRIKRIVSQHRRDFTAVYICEHCGHEEEGIGYDDRYFHEQVVPDKACPSCSKKAGGDYQPLTPRYGEGVSV